MAEIDVVQASFLAISAIVLGTVIRTFLPLGMKVLAEIKNAEAENRDPKPPRFHWLYGVAALVNIAILGIPMLAGLDQYVAKILEATGAAAGFFTIVAIAMAAQEIINRMVTVSRPNADAKTTEAK